MRKTGKFATKSQIKKLKSMMRRANNTPAIAITSEAALSGRDFASLAWQEVYETCHRMALRHGLKEINGFYGLDEDGEFVRR